VSTQGFPPEFDHLGGRFTTGGQEQCRRIEEPIEENGIARHAQVQVFANLAGEGGGLFDEAAAMTCSELQFRVRRFEFQIAQPEPCHSRSVLSIQIGLIGLVTRIGRHAVLLGGKRMHNARFKTGASKGPLGRKVVIARSFDDDESVLNAMLGLGLANQLDCQFEVCRPVL